MADRLALSYFGSPVAYAFGGGTTRGAEAFRMRQPTALERTAGITGAIPTFREEFRPQVNRFGQAIGGGIEVLPARATTAQRQAAAARGNLATEAPRQFQLQTNERGQRMYVDPLTGQSMGTVMWLGGSSGEIPEREVPTPQPPSGGPQPAQGTANIAQGIAPTLGETPSAYSGSALSGTAFTPSAGNMGMGAYRPRTTTPQATSIAGGVGPAPLAAPLPNLNFPTREDRILNPYGLSNY